ncbi:hypothetical protein [Streptomyces sp. NRRL S-350]|uniref:hypothetical protein n=1 Tax=Streptomyces sp. NRRL S-350 TaxID=1463902 RepID=UPI0004C20F4D|nr:hypothetical protein [Streptomyces sp. NRRL S-350]
MGLDVFRHSELPDLTSWEALQRTVTESFGDEDDVLMDIFGGLRPADFPVLSRIDPYGDTVLDSGQCATARAEVQTIPDWRSNPQLVLLEALLSKCGEAPGTYVYIAGD